MPHDQRSPRVSPRVRPEAAEEGAQPWYVDEGKRGQRLLDQGDFAPARAVFESILEGLGNGPSYGKAVILSQLGRCLHLAGDPDGAIAVLRDALDLAGKLASSEAVKGLRGTLRSELGDVLRALGRFSEARKSYEAALRIAEELNDLRAQGVDQGRLAALFLAEGKPAEALDRSRAALNLIKGLREPRLEAVGRHQLGRVLQETGELDEARRQYEEAARICGESGDPVGALQSWNQLALLEQQVGNPAQAERWLGKAVDADRRLGDMAGLCRHLSDLADLLQNQPGRLIDARLHAVEALGLAQRLDPIAAEVWKSYGLLAAINEKDAALTTNSHHKVLIQDQARDYRQLEHYGPRFVAALSRLQAPSCGRTVMLGRLGWCFQLGGRADLAAATLKEALEIAARLPAGETLLSLRAKLHLELGDTLHSAGRSAEARNAYEAALRAAEELNDLRGQAVTLTRLGALTMAEARVEEPELETSAPELDRAVEAHPDAPPQDGFEVTLHEEISTDYAFEPDLLIDGPRERRVRQLTEVQPLGDDLRPVVAPSIRTWVGDDGAVHFRFDLTEPRIERDAGCTVMRRVVRDVSVAGNPAVVWRLIRQMDGQSTVAQILSTTGQERPSSENLLSSLAAAGVIDVSGRPMGRFLHWATRKGVLPAGGLSSDEVLQLATDGEYRAHEGTTRIPLEARVPERLRGFHGLTRNRRSSRDYRALHLIRSDFDALLSTACGVTGTMSWSGREMQLRAYPSSGALYAVEIYPVVFRVEGLEPAVYHYRSNENVLEVVRAGVDMAGFLAAALPMEREMVAGASAMICLAGSFTRHERKYGQGGYRMMVAESGHISQNLVLAATALGLSARPFGGVFDDLINRELGLDGEDEQFLLGVLMGHAGSSQGA